MEFSVMRTDFLKELSLSQGVVERKTTIPILSNILLDVSNDSVRITATDLELGIRSSCPAKVKKGGSIRCRQRSCWTWCVSYPMMKLNLLDRKSTRLNSSHT